jgi:hypothetical protein
MNVVCLITDIPATRYFVNSLHREFPLSLVIVEDQTALQRQTSKLAQLRQTFSRYGLLETLSAIHDQLTNRHSATKGQLTDAILGQDWQQFNDGLQIAHVPDINGAETLELLRRQEIDVLFDHGTSILKEEVLSHADLALNLHWGLSPYYRGTHCAEWALINWDPFNIGVTIHRLAKKIDGGDILAQQRVEITADDCVDTINLKKSRAGSEIALKALKMLQAGRELRFHPQDVNSGFLTLGRQWTRHCRKQVKYIEEKKVLAQMLTHPARRKRQPIIELGADG